MNKALFLDRDGVINVEKDYLYQIEDFDFCEGIFEVTSEFYSKGFLIIVITNQSGIGRGYYTEEEFHVLNDWMIEQFHQRGIGIAKVYFCPYHPTQGVGKYKKDSFDRKPNPGMILQAKEEFDIDLTKSILIGDSPRDIEAGISAGVYLNILLSESQKQHNIVNEHQRIEYFKELNLAKILKVY